MSFPARAVSYFGYWGRAPRVGVHCFQICFQMSIVYRDFGVNVVFNFEKRVKMWVWVFVFKALVYIWQ